MSQEQKQVTLQEFVGQLRANIILSYDGAKEQALKSFDQVTQKLAESMQLNESLKKSIEAKETEEPKKNKK